MRCGCFWKEDGKQANKQTKKSFILFSGNSKRDCAFRDVLRLTCDIVMAELFDRVQFRGGASIFVLLFSVLDRGRVANYH